MQALDGESHILVVDAGGREGAARAARPSGAPARDADAVARALDDAARDRARRTDNLVPATIALARAGGTVGEWAGTLREVFGEYRAPTGVGGVHAPIGEAMERRAGTGAGDRADAIGHPIRILVGKPGLDGHSNGAEQIAVAARDAAWRSIYQGIRLTPGADRGGGARRGRRPRRPVGAVGLAPRPRPRDACGSCAPPGSTRRSSSAASSPRPTRPSSLAAGVARVYTPKDFRLTEIVAELADLVARSPS